MLLWSNADAGTRVREFPCSVRGLSLVVSRAEIAFLTLCISLDVWSDLNIIKYSYSKVSSQKINTDNFLLVMHGYICVIRQVLLYAFFNTESFLPKIWGSGHCWHIDRNTLNIINTDTNNLIFRTTAYPLTWILNRIKMLQVKCFSTIWSFQSIPKRPFNSDCGH